MQHKSTYKRAEAFKCRLLQPPFWRFFPPCSSPPSMEMLVEVWFGYLPTTCTKHHPRLASSCFDKALLYRAVSRGRLDWSEVPLRRGSYSYCTIIQVFAFAVTIFRPWWKGPPCALPGRWSNPTDAYAVWGTPLCLWTRSTIFRYQSQRKRDRSILCILWKSASAFWGGGLCNAEGLNRAQKLNLVIMEVRVHQSTVGQQQLLPIKWHGCPHAVTWRQSWLRKYFMFLLMKKSLVSRHTE